MVISHPKPGEPVWIICNMEVKEQREQTFGCWLEIVISQKSAVVILLEPVVEMYLIQV